MNPNQGLCIAFSRRDLDHRREPWLAIEEKHTIKEAKFSIKSVSVML